MDNPNGQELVPMEDGPPRELSVSREPAIVLEEAHRAAAALSDVVKKKKNPVIMNGEQYLEFEDWQTLGKFYGITAKVLSTTPVQFGDVVGFEARACAYHVKTGEEISAADSMCLNDETNWKSKPLFQLRSMAQTRACAKALRNVLAWVVVLAGYKPTPAEEMTGGERSGGQRQQQQTPQSGRRYDMTETHKKLGDEILGFCNGDKEEAASMLETLTAWRDKDGREHPGKRSIFEISEKMAIIALKKFNDEFNEPGSAG